MRLSFNEQDVQGNTFCPEGESVVKIFSWEKKPSKAGNDMIVVTVKDDYSREEQEYFPLSEKAKFKIAQFALAAGFSKEQLVKQGLDMQSLVGKKLRMVKSVEGVSMFDGKERKNYKKDFFPLSTGTQPHSTTGASNPADDEIPF